MVNTTELNDRGEFIDPWGTPYRITVTGEKTVTIRSAGSNKKFEDDPKSDDLFHPERPR